jgi:hypothetical protein
MTGVQALNTSSFWLSYQRPLDPLRQAVFD